MGFFNWLGKLFGKPEAPKPAAGVEIVQTDILRQLQGLVQALGGADWYYWRNSQKVGPFTILQLQQLLAAGQLQPNDVVWREGMPQPVPLSLVMPVGGVVVQSAAPPIPAPPQPLAAEQWFYTKDKKQKLGPVSLPQLQQMVQSGQLGPADMVWRQGLQQWVVLSSVAGMSFPYLHSRRPPPFTQLFSPPAPVGPPPGGSAGEVEWYYSADRKTHFAVTSLAYIQAQVRVGDVPPTGVAWRPGLPGWVPLTSVAGMTFPRGVQVVPAAASTPAPPPPSAPPSSPPERGRTLSLDAADFLPITRAELKEQAQKIERWGPWFGRRDLIPPADDPRTKLIDRGLVSNGLLSPEQLTEIHQVGAEMERVRPTLESIEHKVQRSGEEAVQADKEQRAKLKAEKKAESERRKKERAAAIAQRKATDIIFLGRRVSGRLNDRQSNGAKLQSLGLPVLATPADLAGALGLRIPRLRWLAFHTEVAARIHYVQFTVPKKSGGVRTLSAPHKSLAAAQRWILENIVSELPCDAAAHGFLPGKSILSNAQQHVGRAVVINSDLEDFFPSIAFPRVRSVFQRAGYSGAVATILALLCTECPRRTVQYDGKSYHVATGPRGLPQGACTSPGLSNQVARRLDQRLTGLAKKLGLTYTRYADDLTFSGSLPIIASAPAAAESSGDAKENKKAEGIGYLLARIRHIAEAEHFRVNEKKNRVLRRSTAQLVTGLVVNDKASVSRREIRQLRAILHHARREGLDHQNRTRRTDFRAWLEGKIAYIRMVRPEIGAKLLEELRRLTPGN